MKVLTGDEVADVPIGVLLGRWPHLSQVFIRHRLGCIGCPFAKFHTLRDAFEIYRLEEERFLKQLADLVHP